MDFDYQGAIKAGYQPDEIADYLAKKNGFDIAGARNAGYSAPEILQHFGVEVSPKKEGILDRAAKAIDPFISDHVPTATLPEVPRQDDVDSDLAKRNANIESRRQSEGIDQLGTANRYLHSFASGAGAATGSGLNYIGRKFGIKSLEDIGNQMQDVAAARTPSNQSFGEQIASGVGSIVSAIGAAAPVTIALESAPVMAGIAGIAETMPMVARGLNFVAKWAPSAFAGAFEAAGNATQTYDDVLRKTGNKDLAQEQADKTFLANLPVNVALNKFGIFGENGSAVKKIFFSTGSEALQEGTQQAISNYFAANPVGEGVTMNAAAGGAVGGAVKTAGVMLEPNAEAKPSPKPDDILNAPDIDTAITTAAGVVSAPLALPLYAGSPLVVFPDGSTMTRAEAEQRRLDSMVQPAETANAPGGSFGQMDEFATLLSDERADLQKRRSTLPTQDEFDDLLKSEQIDLAYLRRDAIDKANAERLAEQSSTPDLSLQNEAVAKAEALTRAQGFDDPTPTAMQLAMQDALARRRPPTEVPREEIPQATVEAAAAANPVATQPTQPNGPSGLDAGSLPAAVEPVTPEATQLNDLARQWDRSNRTGRNIEWQSGAAISNPAFNSIAQEGENVPAHGMAKAPTLGDGLKSLISMINGGIDQNRTLYYDALTNSRGATSGATSGGHAYRDGPFIITFREGLNGAQPTSADITGVLVNPAHSELVAPLQRMFPNLTIRDYNGVADVVSASRSSGNKSESNAPIPPALSKDSAQRLAKQLSNQGFQSDIVPHPTAQGMFAIISTEGNDAQGPVSRAEPQREAGLAPVAPGISQTPAERPVVPEGQGTAGDSDQSTEPLPVKIAASRNPAPIMIRKDIVGAIMRATGGRGIAADMALTITGDSANNVTRLRGLFQRGGVQDTDDIARMVRDEEGFDVKDGAHLEELVRQAAAGDRILSMRGQEEAQSAEEEARHREWLFAQAEKRGIRTRGPRGGLRQFSAVEAEYTALMDKRQATVESKLEERARRAYDAMIEEARSTIGDDRLANELDAAAENLPFDHKARDFYSTVTKHLKEVIYGIQPRDVGLAERSPEGRAGESNRSGSADADAQRDEEANPPAVPEASAEEGRPALDLVTQTPEELAQKAARENDQAIADRERIKAESEATAPFFSLTQETKPIEVAEQENRARQTGLGLNAKPLEDRHAELDPRVDALNDADAVKVGKELGIEYRRGEDIRAKIKQAHPDDQERALKSIENEATTPSIEGVSISAEQKIRDAFQALPSVSMGKAYPITVEHNGTIKNFMVRQDAIGRGNNKSALHLTEIHRGRMIAGDEMGWIAQGYKLDGKDRLTEEGMPKKLTDEEAEKFNSNFAGTIKTRETDKGVALESRAKRSVDPASPEFKRWFGDWEGSAILNGKPLARLKSSDAPQGGFKTIEDWAAGVFEKQGGKAYRDGLGEILLDRHSAKNSMAHGGANKYKKIAFASAKDVIERGALVHQAARGDVDSYYFSAPIDIDGVINIETVLVHRDANTGRMYLHSVMVKESLLNHQVSRADAGASERSGSTDSEGIARIIQDLIARKGLSKVVDAEGKPLVAYQGTTSDISAFDPNHPGKVDPGWLGLGLYFTSNVQTANAYTRLRPAGNAGENVMPVYLSLKNPLILKADTKLTKSQSMAIALGVKMNWMVARTTEQAASLRDAAIAQGYDGVAYTYTHGQKETEYVVFNPEQIKSAISNTGEFDPENANITESRQASIDSKGLQQYRLRVAQQARDQFLSVFKGTDALDIRVVNSRDEIHEETRPSPYADGVYYDDKGRIYLIADNITDRAHATRILLHEAVGHYGLSTMMGERFQPLKEAALGIHADGDVTNVQPGDKNWATIEAVRRDYPEVSDDVAAQEVLARMAETPGPTPTLLARAMFHVRSWLRDMAEKMGIKWDWKPEEIRNAIGMANDYMRRGDNLPSEGMGGERGLVYSSQRETPPAYSSKSGTPNGMQERPEVRADESGSLAEHAQSRNQGGAGGRGINPNDIQSAAQAFRDSQPIDKYEYDRNLKDMVDEIQKSWESGNSDEYSRRFGPDEVHAQLKQENAPEYYDEDGDLTDVGNDRYSKLERALAEKSAREYLGDPQRKEVNFSRPSHMAEFLHDYLDKKGYWVGAVGGSGKSDSKYFNIKIGGENRTLRISDHPLPSEYDSSDMELPLYDRTGDIRFDGREESEGVSQEKAIQRAFDLVRQLAKTPLESRATTQPASTWDIEPSSPWKDFVYKFQDKYVDLKDAINAIRDSGAMIGDAVNTYLKEELYHKRVGKRTADFFEGELKPLLITMQAMGVKREEFEEYLHARHATEANALIRDRGGMDDGGSGMTDKDAADYMAKLTPNKRKQYEALAKRTDAILAKTRETLVEYGLESKETIDGWAKMFAHYVPLHREDMAEGQGIGQGFSVKGSASKHRTGSSRNVADILGNIAQQRDRAIVRGEKNRVAVSLFGLAYTNPNPDIWEAGVVPMIQTVDKNNQIVSVPDPMYKSRDNVIVARLKDSNGQVHDRAIVFNESNARALRMAAALKNLDAANLEGLIGLSGKITRFMAAMSTQYNPVFVFINFARDFQSSAINLSSTPLAGKQKEVMGHALSALHGIYADLRDHRAGRTPTSKWEKLYEEMQLEGGTTGYREMFATANDRTAKQIDKLLDPEWWTKTGWGKVVSAGGLLKAPEQFLVSGPGKALVQWLSDANETAENAMRLAVFKTALDHGLSKEQAASLAKNISVNFNRKGQVGAQMNAAYAFFNAATQGTARIYETLKGPAGKQIIVGGLLVGVAQAMMMAAAGFDDDEPKDFIKERNLIIPLGWISGKKDFFSIPMPLGFHVLPSLGRISAEFAMRGFRKPGKAMGDMVSLLAEAFNPIGSAGVSLQTLMPTPLDPLTALAENKDWTGKTIAKEDFNKLSPTPGHSRAKDTATWFGKSISEALNTISGGTKYTPGWMSPTPDQIDYLIGQATGGVGREVMKAEQTISSTVTGEDLPMHKVPLLGRVYGTTEGQSNEASRFYDNLKKLNEHEAEIKGRRENKEDAASYIRENPESRLVAYANSTERVVSDLRKRKRKLIEDGASKERIKLIEMQMAARMARFNKRVAEVEQ